MASSIFDADIERSWLYTSKLGDTLSTSIRGAGSISDTGRTGFGCEQGIWCGLLILVFHTQFGGEESIWDFDFAVNNLGLVQWSSKTLNIDVDSNYTWRGYRNR